MTKKLSRVAGVAVLAVVATALAVATAVAAPTPPTPVSVSGTETVIDQSAGTYKVQGSLVGTWYTTKFVVHYASDTEFVGSGKELFVGCLDDNKNGTCDKKEPYGNLKFAFIYWASFDASGALLAGECIHPILGGSGSFRKATGFIHMNDTPVDGGVVTTYTGTIAYSAAAPKSGHSASAHKRRLAAASAAGYGGGCGG